MGLVWGHELHACRMSFGSLNLWRHVPVYTVIALQLRASSALHILLSKSHYSVLLDKPCGGLCGEVGFLARKRGFVARNEVLQSGINLFYGEVLLIRIQELELVHGHYSVIFPSGRGAGYF